LGFVLDDSPPSELPLAKLEPAILRRIEHTPGRRMSRSGEADYLQVQGLPRTTGLVAPAEPQLCAYIGVSLGTLHRQRGAVFRYPQKCRGLGGWNVALGA